MNTPKNFASIMDACAVLNARAKENAAATAESMSHKQAVLQQIRRAANANPGVIPSGPRKRGEGCDDEDQGILSAEECEKGIVLRVTLLAAGFLIGPSGASIRNVSQTSGATIRSWNETFLQDGQERKIRRIVIEGTHHAVINAISILSDAVDRYKDLCEGKYCGKAVDRRQIVRGVEFFYSPPPRSAVPYAAPLKADRSPTLQSGAINMQNRCMDVLPSNNVDGNTDSAIFSSGWNPLDQLESEKVLPVKQSLPNTFISPASILGGAPLDLGNINFAINTSCTSTPTGVEFPQCRSFQEDKMPMNIISPSLQNIVNDGIDKHPNQSSKNFGFAGEENLNCSYLSLQKSPIYNTYQAYPYISNSLYSESNQPIGRNHSGFENYGAELNSEFQFKHSPLRSGVGAVSGRCSTPCEDLAAAAAAAVQTMALEDMYKKEDKNILKLDTQPSTPYTTLKESRSVHNSPSSFENPTNASNIMSTTIAMMGSPGKLETNASSTNFNVRDHIVTGKMSNNMDDNHCEASLASDRNELFLTPQEWRRPSWKEVLQSSSMTDPEGKFLGMKSKSEPTASLLPDLPLNLDGIFSELQTTQDLINANENGGCGFPTFSSFAEKSPFYNNTTAVCSGFPGNQGFAECESSAQHVDMTKGLKLAYQTSLRSAFENENDTENK